MPYQRCCVQAVTKISREIDDVLCYSFHGDLQRTLRGVPITATLILSALPKDSAWPSAPRAAPRMRSSQRHVALASCHMHELHNYIYVCMRHVPH